jgi:hypothetical protein
LKVVGGAAPKPPLCRGLFPRRRPLALGQTPCALGLADGYGSIAHSRIFESQVGATAPTPPLSAALGLPFRRLAIAGSDALGRWGLPPPRPCFPLRSACLTGGSLPRATRRLAGGGCRSHIPAFRCARLVLQMARYRGQRGAWQVGAALGLSCRWLASYIRAAAPLGETIVIDISFSLVSRLRGCALVRSLRFVRCSVRRADISSLFAESHGESCCAIRDSRFGLGSWLARITGAEL